jgi:methionyl-tRNA formyltransferase
MRVVFMGSPELACPALERLLTTEEVVGVVTQPDRPSGRQLKLRPCAAKILAAEHGLFVLSPPNVNDAASVAELTRLSPDIIVVVAFGQILREPILRLPPHGCVNVHASLLPKYRGAAPIQWAVANGETVTGVTTMFMDRRLDAGDIILQSELEIAADETSGALHDRLAQVGAELLVRTLALIRNGQAPRRPQSDAEATLAPMLKKADGRIDWAMASERICNRIRGFSPWPGSMTAAGGGKTLRIWRARPERGGEVVGPSGQVLEVDAEGPLVAAGSGAVRLLEVQPEGGRPMSGAAYVRGHRLQAGDRLV